MCVCIYIYICIKIMLTWVYPTDVKTSTSKKRNIQLYSLSLSSNTLEKFPEPAIYVCSPITTVISSLVESFRDTTGLRPYIYIYIYIYTYVCMQLHDDRQEHLFKVKPTHKSNQLTYPMYCSMSFFWMNCSLNVMPSLDSFHTIFYYS